MQCTDETVKIIHTDNLAMEDGVTGSGGKKKTIRVRKTATSKSVPTFPTLETIPDTVEESQIVVSASVVEEEEAASTQSNAKPDHLAVVNAHERDQYITFDEGPHIYTVHGDSTFTSVTTWNHFLFEKFDADAVAKKMIKNPKWKKDPNYKYYQMSLEEIKTMWSSTEASEAGTKLHFDIECYYNGLEVKNDSIEYRYFLEFARDYAHLEPYRTEWCVYYEELKLSGSIDMLFRDKNTGEFYIYDWKRSKGIVFEGFGGKKSHIPCIAHLDDCNFWHYSLQLNTYRAILEEKYDIKISGMYLIVLHPDNLCGTYDRIQCHDLRKEIADLFEMRRKMVEDGTDQINKH